MNLKTMRPSFGVGVQLLCAALTLFGGFGCDQRTTDAARPLVRGEPIQKSVEATGVVSAADSRPSDATIGQTNLAVTPIAAGRGLEVIHDGFVQLGWDQLSGFKFDVYEFYSETNSGRALLKSDETIPADVKAYDGRRVTVTGFVLPLRIRKQLVTEFLLLRDQGTCCFGAQAKINHFMRVKMPGGFRYEAPMPVTVSGTIRVGEVYIQGYLTGIYQFEAEKVESAEPAMK